MPGQCVQQSFVLLQHWVHSFLVLEVFNKNSKVLRLCGVEVRRYVDGWVYVVMDCFSCAAMHCSM